MTKQLKLKNLFHNRLAVYLSVFFALQFILLTIAIASHIKNSSIAPKTNCNQTKSRQVIIINSGGFQPHNVSVKVCTEVVFSNIDTKLHSPAFGEHDHHDNPPGFNEKVLKQGASNSYTPNQVETLQFHDHLYQDLTGILTVTP